jgi:hypothetical protein
VTERGRHYAFLASLWAVILAAAGVLYGQAVALPKPMKAEELQVAARRVRSNALEAHRMAIALTQDRLTGHFAIQQHSDLARDLQDIRKTLDRPPPRGREQDAARVRQASSELEALLATVPMKLADPAALQQVAAQEAQLAERLGATGSP